MRRDSVAGTGSFAGMGNGSDLIVCDSVIGFAGGRCLVADIRDTQQRLQGASEYRALNMRDESIYCRTCDGNDSGILCTKVSAPDGFGIAVNLR